MHAFIHNFWQRVFYSNSTGRGCDVLSICLAVSTAFFVLSKPAFADFDDGCLAVVVDDDDTIIDATNSISFTVAAQRFYQTHGDDYDFLMFFPNFNHTNGSFHQLIFNDIDGLGTGRPTGFNNRASYNAVSRLQSINNYVNYTNFPVDPEARIPGNNDSTLSLLGQEVGHRWAAFARHAAGDNSLLGRSGSHWSYYASVPGTGPRNGASSLEGNSWMDNGDGTFTSVSQTDGFSELDQYLMGLRATGAVSPLFFIQNPTGGLGRAATAAPGPGDTVNGTRVNVTINDIVTANGARNPTVAAAPKSFRQAFIILAQGGTVVSQANLDSLDAIRTAWESYFSQETDGLGSFDTCILDRPIDVVFLVDISGSFGDDLPVLRAATPGLIQTVLDAAPGSRFALASFSDFPFPPYGSAAAGDFGYRLDLPLTNDSDALIDAVNALTIFFADDSPQSQYEAIFQVMTGAGRDLTGDSDFDDPGEIAPSDIGSDEDIPLFIFMFTDAPFHDSDLEPDYPVPGFPAAGRTEVLALLQNTPFIFGLASGSNNVQLQELADVTGGNVFELDPDSSGFEVAVLEAIDTTEPPPADNLALLDELLLDRVEIIWNLVDEEVDESLENEGLAMVRLTGTLKLPNDTWFGEFESQANITLMVADQPVLNTEVELEERNSGRWVANDSSKLRIVWTSGTEASFRLQGIFDPRSFAISGDSTPMELILVMRIGDENMALTRDAMIAPADWDRSDAEHWRRKKITKKRSGPH